MSAMLGEMPQISGTMEMRADKVAYCSQQAWIQNRTVRDNILFGLPFDRKQYKKACFAAALWSDFQQFKDGDATEIGERGINLSGGQKQRVSFARAIYADADMILLDDVLSAVDVHVGKRMMEEGIVKALAGTTRILVTHAVHFIQHAVSLFVVIV